METRTVRLAAHDVVVAAGDEHRAFWDVLASGSWEPATLAVLTERLGAGSLYVDIGAWIGPTVLCAAARGASVVAFEPDPVAHAELARNLALNPELADRVEVRQAAMFDRDGTMSLGADEHGLGQSVSTLVPQSATAESVSVATLDARAVLASPDFARCTLLKIDVEGGEYRLIPRIEPFLRSVRPTLLLAIHGFHWGTRFASLPPRPRRALRLAGNGAQRAVLLWRLRHYRFVCGAVDGTFRPLDRAARRQLLLDLGERDLLFADSL